MRFFCKACLVISLLLLHFAAQAQYNINSLFSPIDFQVPLRLMEMVSEGHEGIDVITNSSQFVLASDSLEDWKYWSFVENYTFGKDRGALPMITDLNSLHPFFRDQIRNLIHLCKAKGIEIAIVETYRTHAKQHEYKTMGKKYTNSAAGRSKHQYGLAVDVVPIVNAVPIWDNTALWKKIGVVGEKLGLRWGGRWRKPYDPGHFEWTGGLTSAHLGAGIFPMLPEFKEKYPCLEEDIALLRRYWNEWETNQSALTRK